MHCWHRHRGGSPAGRSDPARASGMSAPLRACDVIAGTTAVLSLLAMADMASGYRLLAPLYWATAMLGTAIACAVLHRFGVRVHAAEPFGMAIMSVLAVFQLHGRSMTTAPEAMAASHMDYPGGLLHGALIVTVVGLCAICIRCVCQRARAGGWRRNVLPASAAAAMCFATAAMLTSM